MSYPNEEAKTSTNSLQHRLVPENASSGKLRMKASVSSGTLRPRGIQTSKSVASLPLSNMQQSKVNLDLRSRTLSQSHSALIFNNKETSSFSRNNLVLGADGEYKLDLPPVPEPETKSSDSGDYGGFLNTLNLTADERHSLEHVPNTFFYMRIKSAFNRCSVYDLEVVPQEYIDKDHYFTLSKEGVTIYKDRSSQFTVLSQWEREAHLFNKISNIHFFSVYRRWKAFKVWKTGLRGGKMDLASNALQSSLFLLCAPLRTALLNIRANSMPMASLGMLDMPQGKIFDVDDFARDQTEVADDLRRQLDELSSVVLTSARTACDEVVDQFLKANNIAANHKMTFMERAALRSECRRLTRFLRMVDTMMTDFLMTMIKEAMEKLVKATEFVPIVANFKKELSEHALDVSNANADDEHHAALFDPMFWQPTQDRLTRALDTVINNCCDVVCSFVKVLSAEDTEMYVMPEGDDEEDDDDEGVDLATTIKQTAFFSKSKDMIHRYLRFNFSAINEYCNVFDTYRAMYFENKKYSNDVEEIFSLGEVEAFEKSIKFYKDQIAKFAQVPRFADVGGLLVDTSVMKTEMTPSPWNCINAIKEWLPKLAGNQAQVLLDKVGDMNPIVGGDPNSVENFVIKKKVKDTASEELESYKETQSYVNSLLFLMDDNNWSIPDAVKATTRMLKEGLEQLEKNIGVADGKEEEDAKKFATNVTEEVPKLIKKVGEVRESLDNKIISDADAPDEKVLKYLNACNNDFQKFKARSEKLQEYQNILRLNVDEFEILEDVGADLSLKMRLWKDKSDWNQMREKVLETEINGLDIKSLEKDLERFNRTVFLAGKGLPMSKVVPKLKDSVEEFNPVLPLVNDLGNPCLKDRHWDQVTDLVGHDIRAETPPNAAFTVIDLIDKGITKYQEEVQEMMAKVCGQWDTLDFNVNNYKEVKDLYVLGDTSDVTIALDDSLVTINTVLGSRYLMHFQETLDEWQTCQRNWMYLEVIFGSADIIRQLPGPAKTFQLHNANLDQIQKDLEEYLETKRMAFPRFYFLSNDELLEILSQAKEPRAVQPHLRKCFDNLIKLEFGAEEGSVDLHAMFSGEGERVGLGKNLKARGNVEEWLTAVEKRMKESLYQLMKFGLQDYDQRPRDEWIGCHAGQIVATVAQMTWARDTEQALRGENQELQKLIVMIRSDLTSLVRKIVVALVTTDVHARDIIDELQEKGIETPMDFLWQQQLRYYWKTDYMGATSRLVITPLTDRCWLTLTGSYALKLGGSPAGPAGTGKTESSKDLAKAIGIQCVVFNCSDQIDYKMMGKLFRGLAQGGSWVCLDEFNRIDIEVLSVIAQQLLVLREGRLSQKSIINFMGITIPLVDHHVIITMNPGYAGRTELPDNLQVCFRPVSMMVPNYALIAEIMLFAEGFGDAKNLSRKMCKLYILLKSVLVMAGAGKRGNPNLHEDLVLIRALRDSNVPKFLAEDLPLFAAIVLDLFPGVEIPPDEYGELKVIQMFDIFNIRFGATIVGPAGTGKSSIYRILAALMNNLREKGSPNPLFQKVKFQILNPKSIAMGELYGEFHPLTQEWHDGLRWTVFDGPIDALWIENMNTVLDDNMTLCLANGQRIKLKAEMKCLFEVNDLAVASPATVSRIGVVYVTPTDLGWFPYIQSWAAREYPSEKFPEWTATRLLQLFEPVECSDIQIVISMCTLFRSLYSEDNGNLLDKLFVFAYTWSVGAPLGMPGSGTPFDYFVDIKEMDKPCFITGPMPYDGGMGTSIESKLEKKRKNLLGAPSGKKVVVFVDDINMPTVETYGAQPPVELLRQFLDHKGFYDRDKIFWKEAPVTGRFTRHFNGFLSIKFEPEIKKMCSGVVSGTIEMYHKVSEELLPTPSKFHYTFNLRDISKVFQGTLSRHLKMPMSEEDLFDKPIVFADFLKPDADPKFYEDVPDLNKLTSIVDDQLDNYNMEFPTQMNLVFFEDALCHTARISRILRQPRGNAMLIGVGGSGKQSLTKIAAFVAGMQCLSIEINRGYGIKEFREDIKTFMLKTGVEGNDLVFLFTDTQIVDETMLEDLNNVLNTGEVANLFAQDEADQIVSQMIEVCQANGIAETRDNCLSYFVSRVRDKLHIAALMSVSQRFLANVDLGSEQVSAAVVKMCGFVHRSIEKMSVAFYEELRRKVYTTPKSYLDLISLYMSMLKGLQDVVEVNSDRMKVGVLKLTETNEIVDTLRGELEKLAPQVAKDSAEANIVAEKVGAEEEVVGKQAAETKAVADDAQRDLDRALPALENAVKALNSLTKSDITEEPKWDVAKKLLGKSDFMDMLTGYDKDNIPASRLKKLRKDYINVPEFQPETVEKVSKAGLGLCLWARAMDVYADVAKEVEPKKARLKVMNAELKELCNATVAEKDRLQFESDQTAARLIRAEKLTNGLNSEGVRWKATIDTLAQEHTNLIGDCFLSCACISYYGGFTGSYREKLIDLWLEKTKQLKIPASGKFSLGKTLGDPVMIREWQNQGLPTDDVSVNNGILVDKCRRWPLMIDPQMQANAWLRKKEEANNVQITTMNDTNLLRVLEKCIRLGLPLILEDLTEQMEPALIRLGDSDVDYDDLFKLYMTTKMPNPHYLPEVCIKVTIINFTVTMQGLTDQLLGDVVKAERPDIEERKVQLMLNMAEDKKQLAALEAKILKMLSESEGNILDDEVLINTLSESKLTSIAIGERVAEAELTEVAINETRAKYLGVATRGAIIYFVIADLGTVDPINDLETRLTNIIDYMTLIIYQNICRGLFEKDKLLFSSLVCFQIMRERKMIHDIEWNVFVRGPGAIDKVRQPMNPHPDLISTPTWDLLYGIPANLHAFSKEAPMQGICEHIRKTFVHAENPDSEWTTWMKSPDIMNAPLPAPFNDTVNDFQKLILVKALREDKVQGAIAAYVGKKIGKEFAKSPIASMADIYKDLDNKTPCIFILSSGADPTGTLLRPIAKGLIDKGCETGDWVCLQNCMLAKSWMPQLDKIVFDVQTRGVHKDFRLFLTSSPASYFPISVLQNGVKMTNEPPKGFRANLLGNFGNVIKDGDWEDANIKERGREVAWKKILCGLAFFHAQVQERRKFGPLGWNIHVIPWDAINFATGHINYGGRVTDDWDRRTLMAILSTYYAPEASSKEKMMEYFDQLPSADDPEVFGMHDNANVTFNTNESMVLMESILQLQPRASGGESFENDAPEILDKGEAGPTTFQEMIKFNKLLMRMRNSLRDIKKAIRGMIVMSADLDDMYSAFMNNKVPPIWEKVSFASLKTLASWVRDMTGRVAFMRHWLVNGQPATFPLPVFFFPQGFMTGTLQTFARKHMEAIDGLSFEFEVLRNGLQPELITEGPEDGVIIHGLQPGRMYDLLPAIYFKPAVNHKQAPNTYNLPVYKTAVRKGVLSTTGMSTNFVVPIELPIKEDETEQKYILAGCAALLNLTD
eukprot:GSChrysophyteH1.ASY1.ANO1.2499.1 assembled CDS